MNDFVKNLGIFSIFISVLLLVVYAINPPASNTLLLWSSILLIGGLIGHIVINGLSQD